MTASLFEFGRFRTQIFRQTLFGGIAAGLLLGLVGGGTLALGVWLGALASSASLLMLSADLAGHLHVAPGAAARRARRASLMRTALRTAILVAALLRPEISFPAAAMGLFAAQIVLVVHELVRKTPRPGAAKPSGVPE